jgi:hypothetical protein
MIVTKKNLKEHAEMLETHPIFYKALPALFCNVEVNIGVQESH